MSNDFNILEKINDMLIARGSWIVEENFYNPNLKALFDPHSTEFHDITPLKKILILKELFFCGFEPILLSTFYKTFCKEENDEEMFEDFGHGLLEIIKSVAEENLSKLNIHDPANWYKGKKENPSTIDIHTVIQNILGEMSSELHKQLIEGKNNLIRKRLILLDYSLKYQSSKIVRNADPLFDQIDEELISRVDTYEKRDIKARYIAIEELVEDLHDEFDPEYKENKIEYAKTLVENIENLNIRELQKLNNFAGYNLENIIRAKKKPKEWLYSKISPWEISREIDKIKYNSQIVGLYNSP